LIDWKSAIREEWERRQSQRPPGMLFPLLNQGFDATEIIAAVDVLLDGQLTMAGAVAEMERRFAAYVRAPHAVMVNSGSSANLLALSCASNPARRAHLRPGDEVIVPAVCWSTSIWPIVQCGLRPVFADVDPATLNLSLDSVRAVLSSATRAIVVVHVLGNACDAGELAAFARERDLLLVEDACESLGARSRGRTLGTFGDFGTYSFYYSHHITTGEGGMVVCHSQEDADLLRCLRAHGWSRELSNRDVVERANPDIDPRFLFVNAGYNLRPLEIQGAFGICQLDRLPGMNAARNANRERVVAALRAHPAWRNQFRIVEPGAGAEPAWFGLAMLLEGDRDRRTFLAALTARGVENRPIICGNFTRQPAWRRLGDPIDPAAFPGAELVHERGFFIGVHNEPLGDDEVAAVAAILLES
jgi:CDP-6-deoxy-D-xylo-4-hexulose-3-dehydrase